MEAKSLSSLSGRREQMDQPSTLLGAPVLLHKGQPPVCLLTGRVENALSLFCMWRSHERLERDVVLVTSETMRLFIRCEDHRLVLATGREMHVSQDVMRSFCHVAVSVIPCEPGCKLFVDGKLASSVSSAAPPAEPRLASVILCESVEVSAAAARADHRSLSFEGCLGPLELHSSAALSNSAALALHESWCKRKPRLPADDPDRVPDRMYPFKRIRQLDDWRPGRDPLNVSPVPLAPRAASDSGSGAGSRPRLLHCHDLQGGYTNDAAAAGSRGREAAAAYAFSDWPLIDLFVYFSHARVSLPPRMWVSAAHRNGVKVLATVITEWAEGEADTLRMIDGPDALPLSHPKRQAEAKAAATESKSEAKAQAKGEEAVIFSEFYVDKLVELAREYGLDGWFINIESKMPLEAVPRLIGWLRCLTRKMHAAIPGSEVIWYDSVDALSGEVRWQSRLNRHNLPFFEACDAIFLDYHWKQEYPAESAAAAATAVKSFAAADSSKSGSRVRDVFVGVDVWGRGTFGGGGFSSARALQVIREAGCSAALFAPSWTWEADHPLTNRCGRNGGHSMFKRIESKFWHGQDFAGDLLAGRDAVAGSLAKSLEGWTVDADLGEHGGWGLATDETETDSAAGGGGGQQQQQQAAVLVTSHKFCWRRQLVDLKASGRFLEEELRAGPDVFVSQSYVGTGPNFKDVFRLKVTLLDENKTMLDTFDTGELECSASWQQAQHTFSRRRYSAAGEGKGSVPASAAADSKSTSASGVLRFIQWEEGGRDAEHWAGHFGCRVGSPLLLVARPPAPCVADYAPDRAPPPLTLPFTHSFNPGMGGGFAAAESWFDLSRQDCQTVLVPAFRAGSAAAARPVSCTVRCRAASKVAFDTAVSAGAGSTAAAAEKATVAWVADYEFSAGLRHDGALASLGGQALCIEARRGTAGVGDAKAVVSAVSADAAAESKDKRPAASQTLSVAERAAACGFAAFQIFRFSPTPRASVAAEEKHLPADAKTSSSAHVRSAVVTTNCAGLDVSIMLERADGKCVHLGKGSHGLEAVGKSIEPSAFKALSSSGWVEHTFALDQDKLPATSVAAVWALAVPAAAAPHSSGADRLACYVGGLSLHAE